MSSAEPFPGAFGGPVAFRPATGTMDQWNAAYVRVEDYLRAHRIHNRLHQSRLIQRVLECAARRHESNPALNPTVLAADALKRPRTVRRSREPSRVVKSRREPRCEPRRCG